MPTQIIICLLFAINIVLLRYSGASLCQPTIDYINGKLQSSKIAIAKAYIQEPESVTSVTYDIKWTRLWKKDLDSRALTIGLLDEMFVLIESDQIVSIGVYLTPAELFPNTVGLHEVSIRRTEFPIKFIKSMVWNDLKYLLICYDSDSCSIYTSAGNQDFQHQQTTRHEGRPVDATFFIENDNLYLVIATNLDAYPVLSVVYRWTETYMDIVTEIPLKSVVSVVTFHHKDSTILVFSQSAENSFVGSQIYKLMVNEKSGQGKAESIQFLPTNRPVAMHLYHHAGCTFLLVVNKAAPSQVFWYDGKQFLPWIQIEDIQGSSLVNSVRVDDDTFLFVVQSNFLNLYRITSTYYVYLDTLQITDVIRIIDVGIWSSDNTISLVFISERGPSLYRVEPLQLLVNRVNKDEGMTKTIDKEVWSTSLCLKKLEEKVKKRMIDVDNSRNLWDRLYSPTEDVYIDELETDVILRASGASMVIENLEMVSDDQEEIIPPQDLNVLLKNFHSKLDESLNRTRNLPQNDSKSTILTLPSLIVENHTTIKNLEVPMLMTKFMNDQDPAEPFKNVISATKNQIFEDPLEAKHVIIENLEVDTLCGVSKEFWLLDNDSRTPLKPFEGSFDTQSQMRIENDTVVIKSDIYKPIFKADVLNSVNLSIFFDNLFIPGENQVINGDVLFENVFIDEFFADYVHGIPKEKLITITTDQNIRHPVFIDSLNVRHLYVGTINGIGQSQAARSYKKNVIKSKVILNHVTITDELIIDDNCDLFKKAQQIQVYENVTINGNVVVQRLQLENTASFHLADEKLFGYDIDRLFSTSWSRSGEQQVKVPMLTFENGLTIDELNVEYLNGMKEDDYLYTTIETIPSKFSGLHFEDFIVNGTIRNDTKDFVIITDDHIIFNERVHFEFLRAMNFFTDKYIGIPIHFITAGNISTNESIEVLLPDDIKFKAMTVNDRLNITDFHFKMLNSHDFSDILFADEDYKVDSIKTNEFRIAEFSSESTRASRSSEDFSPSEGINLIIDGPLIVDNDFHIEEFVNEQRVSEYLATLSKSDVRIDDPSLVIEHLRVSEDATVVTINGNDFNRFVDKIFSKTQDQELIGIKTYHRLTVKKLNAKTINDKGVEDMYFVDEPLVFNGNVTFDELSADVDTRKVNDIATELIQANVSYILSNNITNMKLTGKVTWKNNNNSNIFSDILSNAVLVDDQAIIEAPVDFSKSEVYISSIQSEDPVFSSIYEITKDAVLDDNVTDIKINGKKTFSNNVTVKILIADHVEIDQLETMTIRELNSSIVRKFDDNKMINGLCIFTAFETKMNYLVTADLGPDMPKISSLFFVSEDKDNYLPEETYFQELVINEKAEVTLVDGVEFNKFLEERVTLTGDHLIQSSVRFNGHIEAEEVEVKTTVNGIRVKDIVVRKSTEPQVIAGEKTFVGDLIVDGNVDAVMFNGINIIEAYNQAVFTDGSPVITGDLIIEGDIEIFGDTKVAGTANGIKLNSFLDKWDRTSDAYLRMINENMTALSNWIDESVNIIADKQPKVFHHFEFEEYLKTGQIENVHRAIPTVADEVKKLHIYASQRGENCLGLSEMCFCRSQHVIEFTEGRFTARKENYSASNYIFQDANNDFTISVTTNSLSSSENCTQNLGLDEFTAISWMTRNNSSGFGNVTLYPEKIEGFLSDVQVFIQDEAAYIVLVMSYDPLAKTHLMNCMIFGLNLKTNDLKQVKSIPMISASAVEVFKISGKGSYILIASDASSDLQSSPVSVLYRLSLDGHEFEIVQSFYTGGTKHLKSIAQGRQDFLLMDDIHANSVHIYNYEDRSDNFDLYQSLYFDAPVTFIDAFYTGDFRMSDLYVVITTGDDRFFLYQYMMFGKFQKRMSKWVDGLLAVTPFHMSGAQYLVLIARDNSTMYRIIQRGSN